MRLLPVRRPDRSTTFARVDDADFARLSAYSWRLDSWGYVGRSTSKHTLMLHREIMGLPVGDPRQVDHRNHDKLDNQRSNLRVVTHAQNKQNLKSYAGSTSGFRGVSWETRRGKWVASGKLDGKRRHLGYFSVEEEAAACAAAWRAEHMPFSAEAAA